MSATIGFVETLNLSVFDTSNVLTDAATVSLAIVDPAGTTTTVTLAGAQVVRDSTGTYHYNFTPTLVGVHTLTWTTTTPATGTLRYLIVNALTTGTTTSFSSLQSDLFDWGFQFYNDAGTGLASIKRALNDSYMAICMTERWPFLFASLSGAAPLTVSDLSGPANVEAVVDTANASNPLDPMSRGEVDARFSPLTTTGAPQVFYVQGGVPGTVVKTYPVGGTLLVTYYRTPLRLVDDSDEPLMPEEWRYLIVTRAAWRMAVRTGDAQMAQLAQGEFLDGYQLMRDSLGDDQQMIISAWDGDLV